MFVRQIAAAITGLALIAPVASAAPGGRPAGINARQHRQAARIHEGIEDGQITRAEANRLRGDEAAIRAEERVYRRSGGRLSPAEHRDLQHDLNQTSREIYRARHNGRNR